MLCPFHGEEEGKPGRLYVQAEDGDKYGLFFCHVCTARGTINKIRKHFGDSLLDINPNEEANPIVEVAAQYYHDRLFDNYEPYLYLEEERGLNEKTIVQARLGYADGNLGLHLLQKGYLPEQIKESGLMKIDGTDYFKDEIIFPYLKYGRAMQLRGKKIGGKTRSMTGIKAMLYNGDAILGEDTVTIEEGEIDVLTMQQLGYNAVGVPGALVWKPEWTDQLEDAKRVYILFDADSAGRSGAEKLAQTIGPRSRIVELPKKGIDVNDYFVKYAKQREDFDWLFSKAKGGLLVTVQQSFESWTEIEGNPDLAGLRFNIGPMDKVLQFGLLPGDIMTVLARTNVGKSLWVINMTHRMRMADPNFKCLFVSLEQTRSAWFERAHRIHNFYNPGETVMSTVDYWKDNILLIDKNKISEGQLIDSIEQFAYEIGEVPSTVVVDYLGYYARSFPGNSKEQTTDAIMGLKSMAKDIGVSIVAPAQANRTGEIGEELTLEMCKDAATIEETSDLLISLWSRDQKIAKEDEDERTNMVNQRILKSRQGGLMSLMQYQMAPLTLALVPSDDELYDRAVKERSYALQGLNWKEAVQLHMNNQVAF